MEDISRLLDVGSVIRRALCPAIGNKNFRKSLHGAWISITNRKNRLKIYSKRCNKRETKPSWNLHGVLIPRNLQLMI
jgi:hypothetical protein